MVEREPLTLAFLLDVHAKLLDGAHQFVGIDDNCNDVLTGD